jgi:NADH-quinone oxidoreductase subunit G
MAKATAAGFGLADGAEVSISSDRGEIVLPVELADLPEGVVWLPANSPGCTVARTLGVTSGAVVAVSDSAGGAR